MESSDFQGEGRAKASRRWEKGWLGLKKHIHTWKSKHYLLFSDYKVQKINLSKPSIFFVSLTLSERMGGKNHIPTAPTPSTTRRGARDFYLSKGKSVFKKHVEKHWFNLKKKPNQNSRQNYHFRGDQKDEKLAEEPTKVCSGQSERHKGDRRVCSESGEALREEGSTNNTPKKMQRQDDGPDRMG